MKKIVNISLLCFLISIIWAGEAFPQLAKNSWSLGFGASYPRFASINTTVLNSNYGGFVSIQRNFSEHIGLRFKAGYSHLESEFINVLSQPTTSATDAITGDLDILFYLVPCESVSPYLFGGLGGAYKMLDNVATPFLDANQFIPQMNAGVGIEWCLGSDLNLITEFGYHITNNSEFEGALGIGEVNGRDTYMRINLGLNYYFSKGEPSSFCQLYSGLSLEQKDMTDYDRIEEMIKRHIPKEVVKEVVVEKPTSAVSDKWVLIGVNFEFNSAKITSDSYPILFDAVKTLLRNPNVNVEIQGFTDNIGSEQYNVKLSQRRADAVRTYLISKGVSANRLKAVGYGESNPVADNKTADGRAMNRRIEFKIQ